MILVCDRGKCNEGGTLYKNKFSSLSEDWHVILLHFHIFSVLFLLVLVIVVVAVKAIPRGARG